MRHVSAGAAILALIACGPDQGISVGQEAPLFAGFDQNMEPVDMADMIDGRPLVLIVGSAS